MRTAMGILAGLVLAAVLAGGGYWLGHRHGYAAAESVWQRGYVAAAGQYLEDAHRDAEAAQQRIAELRRAALARQQQVTETRHALDTTPAAAVFSADELRALEALHRAYVGDSGSVSGGMPGRADTPQPRQELRRGSDGLGLRLP